MISVGIYNLYYYIYIFDILEINILKYSELWFVYTQLLLTIIKYVFDEVIIKPLISLHD